MKSVRSIKAGAVLMILLLSSVAFGAEADFYIDFSTCQNIFGALRLIEQPIITDKGDPVLNACNRKGNRITCRLHFEGGKQAHKGNIGEYRVTLDSPPLLHYQLIEGNEYIAINTVERAAVMSSLIVHEYVLGSKVCHGVFLTAYEFKKLREMKKGTP
jgi:hypothetical protein